MWREVSDFARRGGGMASGLEPDAPGASAALSNPTWAPRSPLAGFGSLTLASAAGRCGGRAGVNPSSNPRRRFLASSRGAALAPLVPRPAAAGAQGVSSLASPLQLAPGRAASAPSSGRSTAASAYFPDPLALLAGPPAPRGRPEAGAARRTALLWFRTDLRLHDNEALGAALAGASSLVPVFCFDPREFGKSAAGFEKTGAHRAQFLQQCVADLRERLRRAGSELLVRVGRPEEVLPRLVREAAADAVFCHAGVTAEEAGVQAAVEAAVKGEGAKFRALWGSTLYHKEDLPAGGLPTTYAAFRAAVKGVAIRAPEDAPPRAKGLPLGCGLEPGALPSLEELGVAGQLRGGKGFPGGAALVGGETEALRRMESFLKDARAGTQSTRGSSGRGGGGGSQGATGAGANFSCKISPWLALGCLSPRLLYQQVAAGKPGRRGWSGRRGGAAAAGKAGDPEALRAAGLSWLVFELTWRDFFRFVTAKYAEAGARRAEAKPAPAPALAAA
eukprot:jgi/Tetstr1/464859/TSEL_009597.t1